MAGELMQMTADVAAPLLQVCRAVPDFVAAKRDVVAAQTGEHRLIQTCEFSIRSCVAWIMQRDLSDGDATVHHIAELQVSDEGRLVTLLAFGDAPATVPADVDLGEHG